MAIALTGFLTGFAKGAKERIEKEREENEALIESRLKMANTNRLKAQVERDAQRQVLRDRYDSVRSYLPAGATEEQKLALISNPEMAKKFVEKEGRVDVNEFILLNKENIPKNFTTVQKFIEETYKPATPLSETQMQQAFGETRGFLGARTGVSAGGAERLAKQYGVPAAELLAYEQKQELPRMPEVARMNVELLKEEEKAKTPEQRIQMRQNAFIDAVEKYGADSPEAEAAKQDAIDLAVRVKSLNPTQEKFSDMLDKAKVKAATARPGTPEHKAAMAEVDRLVSIGKREEGEAKLPSIPQMRGLFSDTVTRAVTSKFGSLVGKDIAIETSLDGTSTYKYIGTDAATRQQIREEELKALARQYRTLSDGAGRPLNSDVQRALIAYGVEFDRNGVPIFGGAAPQPQPTPPAGPVSPVGASRVTPGAATPPAAPTAPLVTPRSMPTAPAGAAQTSPVAPQPPITQRTRTRTQIETVAAARGVSYEEAKRAAEAQGIRVID